MNLGLQIQAESRLLKESFIVRGSTTSKSKADRLINEGIKASVLQYNPHAAADIGDFFSSETLFLNIPFRRTLDDPRFYVEQIKAALHDAQKDLADSQSKLQKAVHDLMAKLEEMLA